MLTCHVKACIATANRIPDKGPLNFPLEIITQEEDMEIVETEFSREFMLHMLQTIDYKALYATSVSLRTVLMNSGQDFPTLPEELPSDVAENEDLLRAIHRIVLGVSDMYNNYCILANYSCIDVY